MQENQNPLLILIRGLPGTGKSTVAHDIEAILKDKIVILDPDTIDTESKDFLDFSDNLRGKVDEKIFPYRYLLNKGYKALEENKIVIWGQAWTKLWGIKSALKSLREKSPNLKPFVIEIELPLNIAQERINHRVNKGGKDLNLRPLEEFLSAFEKWDDTQFEEVTYFKIDGLKPSNVLAKEILEKII
jgi:adenylate kinase family enzyme